MSIDTLKPTTHEVADETSAEVIFLPEHQLTDERQGPAFMAAYSLMLCQDNCPLGKLSREPGHKLCAAEVLQCDGGSWSPAVQQGFAIAATDCLNGLADGKPMPVHQII